MGWVASGHMPYVVADALRLKRKTVYNDLQWLVRNKWIVPRTKRQNKYNQYLVTDVGAKFLSRAVKAEEENRVRAENYRWKSKIENTNNLGEFLKNKRYEFSRSILRNNVESWYGYDQGITLHVTIGSKSKPTLTIIPAPFTGKNLADLVRRADGLILGAFNAYNKKFNLGLTSPEPERHPQFAIHDEFAEKALALSGGEQIKIRTTRGEISIDKSSGDPRIEFPDYRQASDWVDMPELIKAMRTDMDQLRDVVKTGFGETASSISEIAKAVTDLTKHLTGQTSKTEPVVVKDLNDESKRMFG